MATGAFAIVMLVARRGDDRHALTDYRGLASARPVLAGLLTLFLLAQAGVPFTGGFVAKLSVFSAAIDVGQYWLARRRHARGRHRRVRLPAHRARDVRAARRRSRCPTVRASWSTPAPASRSRSRPARSSSSASCPASCSTSPTPPPNSSPTDDSATRRSAWRSCHGERRRAVRRSPSVRARCTLGDVERRRVGAHGSRRRGLCDDQERRDCRASSVNGSDGRRRSRCSASRHERASGRRGDRAITTSPWVDASARRVPSGENAANCGHVAQLDRAVMPPLVEVVRARACSRCIRSRPGRRRGAGPVTRSWSPRGGDRSA